MATDVAYPRGMYLKLGNHMLLARCPNFVPCRDSKAHVWLTWSFCWRGYSNRPSVVICVPIISVRIWNYVARKALRVWSFSFQVVPEEIVFSRIFQWDPWDLRTRCARLPEPHPLPSDRAALVRNVLCDKHCAAQIATTSPMSFSEIHQSSSQSKFVVRSKSCVLEEFP